MSDEVLWGKHMRIACVMCVNRYVIGISVAEA